MIPKVYGARPRPRAIGLGLYAGDLTALATVFPTLQTIDSLTQVRQLEYDVLVTREDLKGAADHLFVLALGSTDLGRSGESYDVYPYGNSQIGFFGGTMAREFVVPEDLAAPIRRVIVDDLLPKALATAPPHRTLAIGTHRGGDVQAARSLRPFLQASGGAPLAGSFVRPRYASEVWALPHYADLERWAPVAIELWRPRSPDRFPRPWTTEARWLTAEEEEIAQMHLALQAEREATTKDLDAREEQLVARARLAGEAASLRERRLVTAQGPELVAAVEEALNEFGFQVQNMDAVFPEGDRREDLRITTPDDPQWEAIAEVRGYAGGAQVSDLLRLTRFVQRYRDERGRDPSGCWYICNQFIGSHPSERAIMLASNPQEVAAFREAYPLALMDTREVFQLQKRIGRGEPAPDRARAALRELNDALRADLI